MSKHSSSLLIFSFLLFSAPLSSTLQVGESELSPLKASTAQDGATLYALPVALVDDKVSAISGSLVLRERDLICYYISLS